MNSEKLQSLRSDFLGWSGGTPPDSPFEITVYVDYALHSEFDPFEARRALLDWMEQEDHELSTAGNTTCNE